MAFGLAAVAILHVRVAWLRLLVWERRCWLVYASSQRSGPYPLPNGVLGTTAPGRDRLRMGLR